MKQVHFRFYEELNDFLPGPRKKVEFIHRFMGLVSVKDMIQAFGVPHTEVDLILVNSKSVTFDYMVNDGDKISVYPLFESFDINEIQKLRPAALRNPKFILDVHLGKLARLMRMLGFDTLYENNYSDDVLAKIASTEKRTVLTRDIGVLKRNEVERGYWLRNTNPEKQLKEVINRFQLSGIIKEFSRCITCNGLLGRISKAEVKTFVPEKVFQFYEKFYTCENCRKIYWKGSHYSEMTKNIEKIKSGFN